MSHTYHTKDMCGMNNASSVKYLTPEECEMACEIERKEAVNETKNKIKNKVYNLYEIQLDRLNARIAKTTNLNLILNVKSLVEEFKKYVEDNI